jgi:hypothetical protein
MIKKCALALFITFLVSCSNQKSIKIIDHPSGKGIRSIDQMIVEMKKEYLLKCYQIVLEHNAPENRCGNNLMEVVLRRFGTSYTEKNLAFVADDIFFANYISKRLNSLIKTNKGIRKKVRQNFSSRKDLVQFYSKAYSFKRFQ